MPRISTQRVVALLAALLLLLGDVAVQPAFADPCMGTLNIPTDSVLGCTVHTGNLIIHAAAVASDLASLTTVVGDVTFFNFGQLHLMTNLTTVSGTVTLTEYGCVSTPCLDLGLPALESVGGSLRFNIPGSLSPMTAGPFPALREIGGDLNFNWANVPQTPIATIAGFSQLTQVGNTLVISGIDALHTMTDAFVSLTQAATIALSALPNLAAVDAFPNLQAVDQLSLYTFSADTVEFPSLEIATISLILSGVQANSIDFAQLAHAGFLKLASTNLTNANFPALITVGSAASQTYYYVGNALYIQGNTELRSLAGFAALQNVIAGNVYVGSNPYLCDSWPTNINVVAAPNTYTFDLDDSSPLCECVLSSPVLAPIELINCKTVVGDLTLSVDTFQNAYSMHALSTVTGSLLITDIELLLPSLNVLSQLVDIGGDLIITNNDRLLSTTGPAPAVLHGSLIVRNNSRLQDLAIVHEVGAFTGSEWSEGFLIDIQDNPALVTLDDLSAVAQLAAGASVSIQNNAQVCDANLPGSFPTPTTVMYTPCTTTADLNALSNITFSDSTANRYVRSWRHIAAAINNGVVTGAAADAAGEIFLAGLTSVLTFATDNNRVPDGVAIVDVAWACDSLVGTRALGVLQRLIEPTEIPKAVDTFYGALGQREGLARGCTGTMFNYTLASSSFIARQVNSTDVGFEFATPSGNARINIPASMSSVLPSDAEGCKGQSFIVYTNPVFPDPALSGFSGKNASSIVSFSITAREVNHLPDPVEFSIQLNVNSDDLVGSPVCAYWNFTTNLWETNGCTLVRVVGRNVTCACTHLTNFAVLFGGASSEAANSDAVTYAAYAGCALSILGSLATFVTFALFPHLRVGPTKLVMQLCVALIATHILLISSPSAEVGTDSCKAIAVILHYFLLAGFAWMLSLGVYLYYNVVLLQRELDHHFKWHLLVSWGVPLLAVVSFIIADERTDAFGYGRDSCWIDNTGALIGSFIVPVLLVVTVNLAIFVRVFVRIHSIRNDKTLKKDSTAVQFRVYLTMLTLLGATWIFAYFALVVDNTAAWVIFIICCSLQGFFIFLAYCWNDRTAKAYKQLLFAGKYGPLSYKKRTASQQRLQISSIPKATQPATSEIEMSTEVSMSKSAETEMSTQPVSEFTSVHV
ncbi:hypothetical protein CAOG_00386 [Capsaspora owczarzaki ATCC 30864]|uniref:G-protein coupled receptors family 2 profile 2 domain-containing protein n=1 Tax=Capsaspora owczarzaki (strain ATCC 30864) TaxID=595528 RepID=A0A0D2VG47_CAPO3|nr:hypothetical protein CAOG_00386 [Capsaspora owczarzaki ATCC 30864]KJE88802.1 hypothetical protein CAOG_000386 [Capsaspora owczarzaki ATCC 30864]|eukprot:XP_004365257.1 hypothetical protein CAOG_00386 [Capsaspora owczarzaki ATCC 30864]